ncbi:MAG: hypothetical protein ACLP1X_29295 [Polyangiaceae bacterium]
MKLSLTRTRRQLHSCRDLAWLVAATSLLSACPANVVLQIPPSADPGALGAMQRCEAPQKPCVTDPVQDGSRFNASNTAFLNLPNCQFGIEKLLVQNSGSSDAVAIVQCAAPPPAPLSADGGIPTMAPGGGTTSGH